MAIGEEFYTARGLAQRVGRLERAGVKKWEFLDEGLQAYNELFEDLLGQKVENWLKLKANPRVLNFIGGTGILEELRDGQDLTGVALGLVDHRTDEEKATDASRNIYFVEGDAFKGSTWHKLDNQPIGDGDVSGQKTLFDAVLCAPKGAWYWMNDDKKPPSQQLTFLLTNKLWERLNPDEGTLLINYPRSQPWVEFAKDSGLDITESPLYGGLRVKIVRHPNDPTKIPFNQPFFDLEKIPVLLPGVEPGSKV